MTDRAQVPGARSRGSTHQKRQKKSANNLANPVSSAPQRACACGGSCPRCAGQKPRETIGRATRDARENERQADRLARQTATTSITSPDSTEAAPTLLYANANEGRATVSGTMGIDESTVAPGLQSGGEPLDQAFRLSMEGRLGQDLGDVRIHKDADANRSARSVNAAAFTYGDDIVFRKDAYDPRSIEGQQLIAHELTHVVQQRNLASPYVARSVNEWLTGSVNIRGMSYTELLGEIDELVQWQNRQIESNEETVRIDEALQVLRRESRRRESQTQQRPRRRQRRRARAAEQEAGPNPIRRPRVLVEMNSVAYDDPAEMRAEFDLIMEWLTTDGLSTAERELLQVERQNLAPQLQEDREQVVQQRRTARLRTALTPAEQDEARALQHAARTIQEIERDSAQPDISYIYHEGERIPIATQQANRLRSDLLNQLQRAHRQIAGRVQYYMGRYDAQIELNENTFAIDVIAGWLGGVSDPGEELASRSERAETQLARLEQHARDEELVAAAAALAPLERNAQVIRSLSRAFYEGHIEGAGMAITGLEFTRDASFAIAGSIAAVVAAPLVAGAVAGMGATGVLAGAATTVGTGLVVGTGSAVVRGSSSALGHGIAGSSGEQITEAFIGEAMTGFREGFMAGAAGGAARVLGPALGVGTQVSAQLARRAAAGAIVDGTASMVEVLWRGGSLEDAVTAGLRSAALSIPGSLVGASGNRLVREIGGPLTAGATAYLGAVGSGASSEEAMRAAGLAVTSNIAMSRATHGSDADAALEARGRAIGENVRSTAARTRRRVATSAAAVMIGTADPIPALRSGAGSTSTTQIADVPNTPMQRRAATAADVDTPDTATRRGGEVDADADVATTAQQPTHNEVDLPPVPQDAPPLELAEPGSEATHGAPVAHNEIDLPESPEGARPLDLADENDLRFDLIADPHNEVDLPRSTPAQVVTRLQDVDISPTSLSQQQRVQYEQGYVQYEQRVRADQAAGRRRSAPMSQDDYVRFRHGVSSGQLQRGSSSQINTLIDEALQDAVVPERAFGFDADETDAAGAVLGRPMTSAEIEELGQIWQGVGNDGEPATLTRENSRRLFDNQRGRFWRAVRRSSTAVAHFESMGFRFPDGDSTAPVRVLPDGRTVRVTIDHITERQADPTQSLDPNNLRFSFGRENSVVLRLITELDPFQ